MRRARRRGLWLALVVLCPWGCGSTSPIPSACSGANHCPAPSSLLNWAAQLLPSMQQASNPVSQTLVTQELSPVVFDSQTGIAELHMRAPANLTGTVADAVGMPVPQARVTVTLPSILPGQAAYTVSTDSNTAGAFSLVVPVPQEPSTQPYQLWMTFDDPLQAALHPPLSRSVTVSGDTMVQLRLQPEATLSTVSGLVLDANGVGVPNIQVQVMSAAGDILSATVLTGTAQGPGSLGSYRVLLDPNMSRDTTIYLVAQPSQPAQAPILVAPLARPLAPVDLQLNLQQPAFQAPLAYQLQVQGVGPSGVMLNVAGANVQAQAQLATMEGSGVGAIYLISGQTDGQGAVTLPLLPGSSLGGSLAYQMTVTSPAASPLSSRSLTLPIGAVVTAPLTVTLAQRPQIYGRIVAADGAPVPGAQVVARGIPAASAAPSPQLPMLSAPAAAPLPQTQTDSNGRFALRLDAGAYDLDIVPQVGTQPRFSLDNQSVQGDLNAGTIQLPLPTLGQAHVLGPAGYPVAGIDLRVFEMPGGVPRPSDVCSADGPCSKVARLRAELSTDSNGVARFLLPGQQ